MFIIEWLGAQALEQESCGLNPSSPSTSYVILRKVLNSVSQFQILLNGDSNSTYLQKLG